VGSLQVVCQAQPCHTCSRACQSCQAATRSAGLIAARCCARAEWWRTSLVNEPVRRPEQQDRRASIELRIEPQLCRAAAAEAKRDRGRALLRALSVRSAFASAAAFASTAAHRMRTARTAAASVRSRRMQHPSLFSDCTLSTRRCHPPRRTHAVRWPAAIGWKHAQLKQRRPAPCDRRRTHTQPQPQPRTARAMVSRARRWRRRRWARRRRSLDATTWWACGKGRVREDGLLGKVAEAGERANGRRAQRRGGGRRGVARVRSGRWQFVDGQLDVLARSDRRVLRTKRARERESQSDVTPHHHHPHKNSNEHGGTRRSVSSAARMEVHACRVSVPYSSERVGRH
jgi:hypothetical protein